MRNRRPSAIAPAEVYLCDTPMLRPHAGAQPDLFLRWNAVPCPAEAVDVVVHLHGFSRAGATMPLSEKVASGGLDLSRRARPTVAIMPRGNWLRYTWYDFPALLAGGLDRLVEYGLERFAGAVGSPAPPLDRLILTAHSGGGMPALDAIEGAVRAPDEFYVFDGLYGRDPATDDPMRGLATIDRWLGERLAGESECPGALRVVYIERQTGPFSRAVASLIDKHLAAIEPILRGNLSARYRVELSGVPHSQIAQRCGPDLLADAAAAFDWAQ
ncbi:MAG TPA: hypothetical protein VGF34_03240 [Stellaceae bacterium]